MTKGTTHVKNLYIIMAAAITSPFDISVPKNNANTKSSVPIPEGAIITQPSILHTAIRARHNKIFSP